MATSAVNSAEPDRESLPRAEPSLRLPSSQALSLKSTSYPGVAASQSEEVKYTASRQFASDRARRALADFEEKLSPELKGSEGVLEIRSVFGLNMLPATTLAPEEVSSIAAEELRKASGKLNGLAQDEEKAILDEVVEAIQEVRKRLQLEKMGASEVKLDGGSEQYVIEELLVSREAGADVFTVRAGGNSFELPVLGLTPNKVQLSMVRQIQERYSEDVSGRSLTLREPRAFQFQESSNAPLTVATPFIDLTVSEEQTTAYRKGSQEQLMRLKTERASITEQYQELADREDIKAVLGGIEPSHFKVTRDEIAEKRNFTEAQKDGIEALAALRDKREELLSQIYGVDYKVEATVLTGTDPATGKAVYAHEYEKNSIEVFDRETDKLLQTISYGGNYNEKLHHTVFQSDGVKTSDTIDLSTNSLVRRMRVEANGEVLDETWKNGERVVEKPGEDLRLVHRKDGERVLSQSIKDPSKYTILVDGEGIDSFQRAQGKNPDLSAKQYLGMVNEWVGEDRARLGVYLQRAILYQEDVERDENQNFTDDWQTYEQTLDRINTTDGLMRGDCDDFAFLAQAILREGDYNPVVLGIPAHAVAALVTQDERGHYHAETFGTFGYDRNGVLTERASSTERLSPSANKEGFESLEDAIESVYEKYALGGVGLERPVEVSVKDQTGVDTLSIPQAGVRSYVRAPLDVTLDKVQYARLKSVASLRANAEFEKSAIELESMAKLVSEPASLLFEACIDRLRQGDLDTAAKNISAAVEQAPGDREFAALAARVEIRRGNTEEALSHLRRAVKLERSGSYEMLDASATISFERITLAPDHKKEFSALLTEATRAEWQGSEHSSDSVHFLGAQDLDKTKLEPILKSNLDYRRALLANMERRNGLEGVSNTVLEQYLAAVEAVEKYSNDDTAVSAVQAERDSFFERLDSL